MSYEAFLAGKVHHKGADGFSPLWVPDRAFPFQESLLEWSCEMGRSATFADCGLGKSLLQLAWAENVVRHTNGRVLILTPLAVSHQTVAEGAKFGIEVKRSGDGRPAGAITVTNYERVHLFDPADFVGVVCDESSILKNFDGAIKSRVTDFMRKLRYRGLYTATAAPNDFTELGTSSEALGHLGHMDMLQRFFRNDQNNSAMGRHYGKAAQWRFKGHAEEPFWRWVCSWARAVRKPSDLGFPDDGFALPPMVEREHVVESRTLPEGMLFALPAVTLQEQREERRRTIEERCERVAELASHDSPAMVWCHLNREGDLLERLVPGAVQVSGSDDDDAKEEKLLGFSRGEFRVLVTKPKIGAWGLNFQHCAHVLTFPSHSYEQYYQSVRRCWRFGQQRQVAVDIVTTEGELGVLANLQQKAERAERMFARLVELMGQHIHISGERSFPLTEEVPSWL
jgi:hypothetical protein